MTERQAEALRLWRETGSAADVARAFGINERTARRLVTRAKAAEAGREQEPEGVAAALEAMKAEGATAVWLKSKEASVYWKRPAEEADPAAWVEALREGLADCRAAPLPRPASPATGRMAVFPVADLHMGMLADAEEAGENWDSKIASRAFAEVFQRLVDVTPLADAALLAQLGDASHVDNQLNVTPGHGHQLDADSRYFKVLRRTVAAMKGAIEALRARYPLVIYRGQRGNHDPQTVYAVTLALAEYYRDVPDVQIVEEAGEFYLHEFGRNMVVLHHGDRVKPDRLVPFCAANWPEVWGRTRHRFAYSGHVHREAKTELSGMTCESFGTIIPRDAYAASHAYHAKRGLVSITLDSLEGEIARARVGIA